jgi:hypothetical protein
MHINSFIRLILFLFIIYLIISLLDGKEFFTDTNMNISCTTNSFIPFNNFSITDTSNNTYYLIDYKDISLQDKSDLPLYNILSSNPTMYNFTSDNSSFKINNINTIYPIFLTKNNNPYAISTLLKDDSCILNNSLQKKIGFYNDNNIKNLLSYTFNNKITVDNASFEVINMYSPFSVIPVNSKYYTLTTSPNNNITFNLSN